MLMQEPALTGQSPAFLNSGPDVNMQDDFFGWGFDNDDAFLSTAKSSSDANNTNISSRQNSNHQKRQSDARRGTVEDSMDFFCAGAGTGGGDDPWSNFANSNEGIAKQGGISSATAARDAWGSGTGGTGEASWVNWEPADFGEGKSNQNQRRIDGSNRQNPFNAMQVPPKSPASNAANRHSRRASLNGNSNAGPEQSLSSSSQNRRGSVGGSRRSRSRRDLMSSSDHNPPSRRRSSSLSRRERLRSSGSGSSSKRGENDEFDDDVKGNGGKRSNSTYPQDPSQLEWGPDKNKKMSSIGTSQRRLGSKTSKNNLSTKNVNRSGNPKQRSNSFNSRRDVTSQGATESQQQDWTMDFSNFNVSPKFFVDANDHPVESSPSLRTRTQSSRNLGGAKTTDDDNIGWSDRRRRAQSSRNLRITQDEPVDEDKRRRGSQIADDGNVRDRLRARSKERRLQRGLTKSPSTRSRRRLVSRESSSGGSSDRTSDIEGDDTPDIGVADGTSPAGTSTNYSTINSNSSHNRVPSKSPKVGLRRRLRREDSSGENGDVGEATSPSPMRSPSFRQRKRRGGSEVADQANLTSTPSGQGKPGSLSAGRRRQQSTSSRPDLSTAETPSGRARRSVNLNDVDKSDGNAKVEDAPLTPTAMITRASETLAKTTSRRNLTTTPSSRRRSTREGFKSHFSGENVAMSPGSIRRSRLRGEHEAPSERRRSRSSSRAAARRGQKSRRRLLSQNDGDEGGRDGTDNPDCEDDESTQPDVNENKHDTMPPEETEALQFSVANNFAKSADQGEECCSKKSISTSAVLSAKKKMRAAFQTVSSGFVFSSSHFPLGNGLIMDQASLFISCI